MKRVYISIIAYVISLLLLITLNCGDDDGTQTRDSDFNIVAHYPIVSTSPCGLTFQNDFFFLVDRAYPGKILKLSPEDGTVIDEFESPGNRPTSITWDGDNFWTTDEESNKIYKHNTEFDVVEEYQSQGDNPSGIVYMSDGKLYTCDWVLGKIFKYNPDDMNVEAQYEGEMNFDRFFGMAEIGEVLWCGEYYLGYLVVFNSDFSVNKYYIAPWEHPAGIHYDGEYVWVVDISIRSLLKCEMPSEGE